MNIIFVSQHKYWGGLQNNGGSKTIIRSAETLQDMGHKVTIWTHTNRYNWHKPKVNIVPHIGIKLLRREFDVAIAVSVSDIDIVNKTFGNKVRKFWWCRGEESWQCPKERTIKKSKKIDVIVNSSWLLDRFQGAELCYAGLDLDFWKSLFNVKPCIGYLHNKSHKTKNVAFAKKVLNELVDPMIVRIKGKSNDEELRQAYSKCGVWLATSTSEGFHGPPAESALCGALVVYKDTPSGGTGDYCTPSTGMPYRTLEECVQAIENPDYSKVAKMQEVLKNKIGSRKKCMKRFVELIS